MHQMAGLRHADRGRAGSANRGRQLAAQEGRRQRVLFTEHKMHRNGELRWMRQQIQPGHVSEHPPLDDVHGSVLARSWCDSEGAADHQITSHSTIEKVRASQLVASPGIFERAGRLGWVYRGRTKGRLDVWLATLHHGNVGNQRRSRIQSGFILDEWYPRKEFDS